MSLFNFGRTLMKNLFQRPATTAYPAAPLRVSERTRGQIAIDIDQCIFCGLCQRKCPSQSITVNKAEKSWQIERMRCVQCSGCVEVCPKKCLSMLPVYTAPSTEKQVDRFTPDHA